MGNILTVSLVSSLAMVGVHASAASRNAAAKEDYVRAPMPPSAAYTVKLVQVRVLRPDKKIAEGAATQLSDSSVAAK